MIKWWGVSKEERVCRILKGGEVEDVKHLVMRCISVAGEREREPDEVR